MNGLLRKISMDYLRGIESFVKAVEEGSIAAAARRLGITPAAASQNIARLEAHLNSRLLVRTTRSLGLTDSGQLYYDQVRRLVYDLELANASISGLDSQPQGRLCIASTAAFGRHVLAPLLPAFNARYPRISLELLTTDRNVDHIQESVDVSIRIGEHLEDGMVARLLATVPSIFCAAPAYLARAGRPQMPEDLREHDCLVFRTPFSGRFLRWGFVREGLRFDADVRVAMISDDVDVLARLAIAGGGVTRLAAFIANSHLETGDLEELFSADKNAEFYTEAAPLEFYLCVRDRYQLTPKVRALMDYLIASMPMEWRTA